MSFMQNTDYYLHGLALCGSRNKLGEVDSSFDEVDILQKMK